MKTTFTTMRNKSSLYPLHPSGTRVLLDYSPSSLTRIDRLLVILSSCSIIGSVIWFPALITRLYRRYKKIPKGDTRRRYLYAGVLTACLAIYIKAPHHRGSIGNLLRIRRWPLWQSWLRYIAIKVILDAQDNDKDDLIVAMSPHGIFPFSLAFCILPETVETAFGRLAPVVAPATRLFPLVRDFIAWLNGV
jgi:hypothetical protein